MSSYTYIYRGVTPTTSSPHDLPTPYAPVRCYSCHVPPRSRANHSISLYTILPCRILYGVRHNNRGSEGGRILRNGRTKVLQ